MCGIVGELHFHGQPVQAKTIERMRDCIQHRGPDDAGLFIDRSLGFGFRRLAILDLSPAGHQPMSTPDGQLTIIFNGEIYNFQILRQGLEKKKYQFQSHTDTEVILALYQEYGLDFVQHLRGMFAIALWDASRERLILVRDRLGKKPLKYYLDQEGIIFGSELKAILEHPRVPRQVDNVAIHHYLTYQYVPCPRTGFLAIHKLPPAHMAVIEGGTIKIHKYWSLNTTPIDRPTSDWIPMIQHELSESVRLRMISDVPLGAFLSGGIDSSAVVAMMARHSSQPVKTFSIGFREASYNELPYAAQIAKKFGTDHTEFVVDPQAVDILPKIAWHYEEPFADSSALPTYILSELTRQHVTVALNGDGGDENFAGYERYPIFGLAMRLGRLPRPLLGVVHLSARLIKMMYANTLTDRLDRFSASLQYPAAQRYQEYMRYFSDRMKQENYTPEFASSISSVGSSWTLLDEIMKSIPSADPITQAVTTDIQTYLPDDLLVKVDIASMAWSLEGRSPFLDHKFMELCAPIPSHEKIQGRQKKVILRSALRGTVPDEILDRPKKGFGVPIEHWFRGELYPYVREHLLDGRFAKRNIFQPKFVEQLVTRHARGRVSYAYQLWALLMLELWYEQYFD